MTSRFRHPALTDEMIRDMDTITSSINVAALKLNKLRYEIELAMETYRQVQLPVASEGDANQAILTAHLTTDTIERAWDELMAAKTLLQQLYSRVVV